MWKLDSNRADFLELIPRLIGGENINVKEIRSLSRMGRLQKDLCLVWLKNPENEAVFPSFIIVNDGEKRDFLAWINTYAPFLRPLTGKIHVLEYQNFINTSKRKAPINKRRFLGAAIGLMIAEANLNKPYNKRSYPTYRECLATLGFSLGSALFSGVSNDDFAYTAASWGHAQKNSRRVKPNFEHINMLLEPWGILIDLCNNGFSGKSRQNDLWSDEQDIYTIVMELLNKGSVSSKTFKSLIEGLSIPSKLVDLVLKGTRESRIVAFENLLMLLLENSKNDKRNVADFVIGYLLNQLEPGTLDYMSLALPITVHKPQPNLWYGMIAGLSTNTSVFNYASGIGWDIALELDNNDLTTAPSCDMDLAEFEMLLDSERIMGFEKSKRYGSYVVELMPNVNTIVAFKSEQDSMSARSELQNSSINEASIKQVINDMNLALQKLTLAKSSLEREVTMDRSSTTRPKRNEYSNRKR